MAQVSAVTGMPRNKRSQTLAMQARLANLPSILAQQSQAEFQKAQVENMRASQALEEKKYGIEQGKFNLAQQEYGLSERKIGLDERQLGLSERRYGLEEKGLAQSEREFGWQQNQAESTRELQKETQAREMGVKAAGLGFNIMGSGTGAGLTIGGLSSKIGDLWGGLFGGNKTTNVPGEGQLPLSAGPSAAKTGGAWDIPLAPTIGGSLLGVGVGKALGGSNKLKSSLIGAGVGGLASYLGSGGQSFSAAGIGGLLGGIGSLF